MAPANIKPDTKLKSLKGVIAAAKGDKPPAPGIDPAIQAEQDAAIAANTALTALRRRRRASSLSTRTLLGANAGVGAAAGGGVSGGSVLGGGYVGGGGGGGGGVTGFSVNAN